MYLSCSGFVEASYAAGGFVSATTVDFFCAMSSDAQEKTGGLLSGHFATLRGLRPTTLGLDGCADGCCAPFCEFPG